MKKTKYKVGGMSCAACVSRVEKSVSSLAGVDACEVNLLLGSMSVSGDASETSVINAVKAAGYSAVPEGGAVREAADGHEGKRPYSLCRLVSSGLLLLVLMYVSMGHVMWGLPLPRALAENPLAIALTEFLLSLAVMLINSHFFISGIRGVLHLSPNMDTLVSLGSLASFFYSVAITYIMSAEAVSGNLHSLHSHLHGLYFESAAMILVLISIGKLLEAHAKGRTTTAIRALMDLTPKTATVIRDGEEILIPVSEISVGETVVIRRGENIPVDGVLTEGNISVDTSALTGESIPVDKKAGDSVLGATTVSSGYAKLRAERIGEETAIAEIVRMVKEASGSKAPIAKAADRVAGIFVPTVLAISLITAIIWLISGATFGYALARAVCVLVISCPCALGLATPVAVMVGSGVGAKCGILFKNAAALEMSGKIKTVAFDKTGTLTEGKPEVTAVYAAGDERDFLAYVRALEETSEHPLAHSAVAYIKEKGIAACGEATDARAEYGGVSAAVGTAVICGGNLAYIKDRINGDIPQDAVRLHTERSAAGETVLMFLKDGKYFGLLSLRDKIRDASKASISELNKMGIETVMITGDNLAAAQRVASELGISRVIAEVMPADKGRRIAELRASGKVVAMVGDGINDSLALTEADVGIAVGAGADVALDSADVVLKRNDPTDVVSAIKLGRKVLFNIYENLFWAFCYNIIGIPLAAGAFIPLFGWELAPMFGALAMSISSFIVVVNALRLNTFRAHDHQKADKMQTNIDKKGEKEMKTVTIKIEGMMCPHCSGRVKGALEAHGAVFSADVSHERGDAIITLAAECDISELERIITDAGYKVVD